MATEVLMPRQGQSVESCIINEWRVSEGDTIAEGDIVCDIETDKATFEVESPASGTVLGIFYPVESDVEVLKTIAVIGASGEDISALLPAEESPDTGVVPPAEATEAIEAGSQTPLTTPQTQTSSKGASPRAKKQAAERGIDISLLSGSGPHGRVIERDVLAAQAVVVSPAAQAKASSEGLQVPDIGSGMGGRVLTSDLTGVTPELTPAVDAPMAFPGSVNEVPAKGVRKLIAERMLASLQNSAQLTHHTSVDARSIQSYRTKCKAAPEDTGVGGISINDVVTYATVRTLIEFPELNAHWLGDRIAQFENIHLGLAVDTPRGLMVPVIRYANLMSLKQLSSEARRLAASCIEGSIDPDVLSGGTFTVSNVGSMGIEGFTPVLNAPEVGILGVCNIQLKPVMNNDEVEFIPHMGLSLTFDHCAIDGAPAARFLTSLKAKLAAFELTLAG